MKKIVYEPIDRGDHYYWERVDRNIGWVTREEQRLIRRSVVGVAGNGGMGGLLSVVLLRAGFGEIRIADKEPFDLSNMNRQYAARRTTIGKSKVLETAKELRRITDDARVIIYPEGICEETVDDFVRGCDLIFDEIEFFAISARILLHQRARAHGVPLINCNVVGFGTRLFLFTRQSMTMEELIGLSYEEAKILEKRIREAEEKERHTLLRELVYRLLRGLVPEFPEYKQGDHEIALQRLLTEKKAPILATNPALSVGFVADRALLYLLRDAGVKRDIVAIPEMPGYLHLDAAKMEAKVVQGRWTSHA